MKVLSIRDTKSGSFVWQENEMQTFSQCPSLDPCAACVARIS